MLFPVRSWYTQICSLITFLAAWTLCSRIWADAAINLRICLYLCYFGPCATSPARGVTVYRRHQTNTTHLPWASDLLGTHPPFPSGDESGIWTLTHWATLLLKCRLSTSASSSYFCACFCILVPVLVLCASVLRFESFWVRSEATIAIFEFHCTFLEYFCEPGLIFGRYHSFLIHSTHFYQIPAIPNHFRAL